MRAALAGKVCLVLGAGGFIGTNLCRALHSNGAAVRGFGRASAFPREHPVSWVPADAGDSIALAAALKDVEVVFHLLGGSIPEMAEGNAAADLRTNAAEAVEILAQCQAAGVKQVVFVSSGGTVYGVPRSVPIPESHPTDPISVYGIHKLLVEKHLALLARRNGPRAVVLRAANPYGPYQLPGRGQGVIATLIARRLSGQPVEVWGDGRVVRDFLHIDDLVEAMLRAALYQGLHPVLNVGSGQGRSILEVLSSIDTVLGLDSAPILYRAGRAADVPVNVLDVALIERELGWTAQTDWMRGIHETAEWLKSAVQPQMLVPAHHDAGRQG